MFILCKFGNSTINFHILYNCCVFGLPFPHFQLVIFGKQLLSASCSPFQQPYTVSSRGCVVQYIYWEGITDGVQSASSHFT
jgi:hypothetical protein